MRPAQFRRFLCETLSNGIRVSTESNFNGLQQNSLRIGTGNFFAGAGNSFVGTGNRLG
jgi:hypothetical protein